MSNMAGKITPNLVSNNLNENEYFLVKFVYKWHYNRYNYIAQLVQVCNSSS